jgi:hypothetical protein
MDIYTEIYLCSTEIHVMELSPIWHDMELSYEQTNMESLQKYPAVSLNVATN